MDSMSLAQIISIAHVCVVCMSAEIDRLGVLDWSAGSAELDVEGGDGDQGRTWSPVSELSSCVQHAVEDGWMGAGEETQPVISICAGWRAEVDDSFDNICIGRACSS